MLNELFAVIEDRKAHPVEVEEMADLMYYALVLLVARGISLADVEAELRRRHIKR